MSQEARVPIVGDMVNLTPEGIKDLVRMGQFSEGEITTDMILRIDNIEEEERQQGKGKVLVPVWIEAILGRNGKESKILLEPKRFVRASTDEVDAA